MTRAEKMIKQLIGIIKSKSIECVPESQMDKIREMYSTLPQEPKGKVAPVWKKNKTAGTNGENTS